MSIKSGVSTTPHSVMSNPKVGRKVKKKNSKEIDRKWDESCKGVRREQRRE
jgi:hypothetical protein